MYSPLIVDKTLARLAKAGHTFTRRSIDESIATSEKLRSIVGPDGKMLRSLSSYENDFIRSEIILCRSDFRYWAERYGYVRLDGSQGNKSAPIKLWASQERALELIAAREEENFRQFDQEGFSDAIKVVWHKTRQQGATRLARLICLHRLTTHRETRGIAASLDESKVHELYVCDHTILDNLPFFLKPAVEFDVKDSHIGFEKLKSALTYQQSNQQAGVGTGQQFDVAHMTEVALWVYGNRLQFDFLPAVPQSPQTFVGFESTANGRGGFWYEFTESVRKREKGFESWVYVFTPWWIVTEKNRSVPPEGWQPSEVTKEHAALIERTSSEFAGNVVTPTASQLYWWQSEWELNKKLGTLHIFLSNYPATPEQSFQHSGSSALPLETMDWLRSNADLRKMMPYEVEWVTQ